MSAAPPTFEATLRSVDHVEGWMSPGQARKLWDRASELKPGAKIVEIGSYQGRSTVMLGTAAAEGIEVVAIDPHAGNDRGPQQIEGPAEEGQADHERFLANLERAGVRERVRHVRRPSQAAGDEVAAPIELLYIDGAHRLAPALADIRQWGAKVADGGTLLIHDSFSSIGVTLALGASLFAGADFRYLGRTGSMAEYRRERLTTRERVTNARRQAAELPWFARNVVIKVLIVVKLGRLTRYLGHPGANWPY